MPDKADSQLNFWQELKRRKVVRVMIAYAASAFIVLEAVDIIFPRMGLPDWTVTLVIFLLIIGFIFSIIMSWIFDITPEGIKKTKSVQAENKDISKSSKRGLKVSDGIIAVLLIIVCILLYPKKFKSDKFEKIRDEEGRISIAVMPFRNMTNDTLLNIWQEAIQFELINDLSNSEELVVRSHQTMYDILRAGNHTNYATLTPGIAKDVSLKSKSNTFIHGNITSSADILRVNAQLVNSRSDEVYKTFKVEGKSENDLFRITDSLSYLIRNYLEIKKLERETVHDISALAKTYSIEAYRYHIKGMHLFYRGEYTSAIDMFNKALETDPDLFGSRFFLIVAHNNISNYEEAKLTLESLDEQIDYLPYTYQLWVNSVKAMLEKDVQTHIKLGDLILQDDPQSRIVWYQQGWNYYRIHEFESAIQCFEKALEIDKEWGGGWEWIPVYNLTGRGYHLLGDHERERKVYELALSILPDHPAIIYNQAVCALSRGDKQEAGEYIERYRAIRETEGWENFWTDYYIGLIYQEAEHFDEAMDIFSELAEADPQNPAVKWRLGYLLIDREVDIDKGMELIDRALESAPGHTDCLYTKGLGYYKQGKIEKAHEVLKRAWDVRNSYYHEHYLLMKEVEQVLTTITGTTG
ncbi:MAG: tetratricopeptide repeat protein [Bacteroidota bacterium]